MGLSRSMLRAGCLAALAAGCGIWLVCLCRYSSSIPFLAGDSRAEWIVYPKPPETNPHRAMALPAIFRRVFVLEGQPAATRLTVRAFNAGVVSINGQTLTNLALVSAGWKQPHTAEIQGWLRAGTNELSVTVSNSFGPPALWLALEGAGPILRTDSQWEVSWAGAAWQPAALASASPAIRPGNNLFGRETMTDSWRILWPAVLGLMAVLCAGVAGIRWAAQRYPKEWSRLEQRELLPLAVLAAATLGCIALFWNNLPQMPALLGFDREGHLAYIDYLLQKKALPLADEGWQMYQPPLFYLISALALGVAHLPATADSSVLGLRVFSALIGWLEVGLVFLSLRLLFPKRPGPQAVGVAIAALLPANLCLSHHVTNEGLAALWVTASLYCVLRVLRAEDGARWLQLAAGGCLGLALLTKFSAVLAIPLVFGALTWRALGEGRNLRRLIDPAAALAVMAAICGWHYARVYRHFGRFLVGNWDPNLPFAWWQEPGYRTAAWYGRAGESCTTAIFSSLSSFADGLYSSLWGDGLCSGASDLGLRPPWDYHWHNLGYCLALAGTVLVVIGLATVLTRWIRRPAPDWFLLGGLLMAFLAGLVYMSLQIASYAQVKAFYALPALLPFCALAAAGWEWIAARSRWRCAFLGVGLAAWAAVTGCAFWIRPSHPATHTARAFSLANQSRHQEARAEFEQALRLAPQHPLAQAALADTFGRLGDRQSARRAAEASVHQHPETADGRVQLGICLGLEQRYSEAVAQLEQAARLAPDYPTLHQPLSTCLSQAGSLSSAIQACREGLRVNPFNPNLHYLAASLTLQTDDILTAVDHLRWAVALKPDLVPALNRLAWILATSPNDTLRNGPEAVGLAERACTLTQYRQPTLLRTLAAAYGESGRFSEALAGIDRAQGLAAGAGQQQIVESLRPLVESFRAGKPYREPVARTQQQSQPPH